MTTGNVIGILFSFVLFIIGMLFTGAGIAFFAIGIIGLICTVFFLIRIVSSILRKMRQGNS
ncbi:putative protein OS=Ureibacillus acetophenoni OX=614649 GN=SAMN05877842_101131 PE=4 SV=1 [Ureibacillus acetophenoni]